MKSVLVTGASGFVGRQCLRLLASQGHTVQATFSKTPGETLPGVHWHKVDLLNSNQIDILVSQIKPTHLLHLAWCTTPGEYWTSVENLRWVQAGLALAEAFVRHGGQRMVGAGTCAEYDWRYGYCSEAMTPLAPATLYGTCKHALQSMWAVFARQMGLSMAWGRVFFVYGPYEHPKRLVPSAINSLLRNEPARCSTDPQFRDYLHVDDVAAAFVALLESAILGPVNIASGQPLALRELINKIASAVGRPDLVQFGAVPSRPDDPPVLVADVRRLKEEVGWQPRSDLHDGLSQTIEWWRARLKEATHGLEN